MAYTMSFQLMVFISLVSSSTLLLPASARYGSYGQNSEAAQPPMIPTAAADSGNEKKVMPFPIGVQGIIFCKSSPAGSSDHLSSGHDYKPIQGAVARITCLAEDEEGYETAPFSVSSTPSDAKGYYFSTLYLSELSSVYHHLKLKECKAFLESSPSTEGCKYPTDENGGVNGAPLTSYRVLEEKRMKLYTVKPFVFSTSSRDDPELAPAAAPFSDDGY